jgi:autotransporter-associated beta strand protein
MTIRLRPAKPALVTLALFIFALTVTLAHDSYGQTINPGDILVGNSARGTYQIIRIDPSSGSQQIITTLPSAWGFCVDAEGFVYTGSSMTPAVQRYDTVTGALVTVSTAGYLYGNDQQKTYDVAAEPSGTILAASGGRLVRINPRTGSQSLLYQGARHAGLAISPHGVIYGIGYWQDSHNERLYRNDAVTGAQTVIFDFGTIESGGDTTTGAIAYDPSTGLLIVGIPKYQGNAAVYRVNPSTGQYAQLGQFPNSEWYLTGVGLLADDTIALSSLGFLSKGQVGKLDTTTGATTVLASISDPFTIGGLHIVPPAAPPAVKWTGVAGPSWTTGDSANWRNRFDPGTYTNGQNVVFDDTADTGSVNLPANVSPSSVRVANLVLPYTFSGAAITGATGLTKDCMGTLILSNVNTYNGPTLINAGTLHLGASGDLSDLSEIRLAAGANFEREIPAGGNYAGRDLRTTFVGGLASKASLLAGNNISGGNEVVAMQWRTRNANETYPSQTMPPIARAWCLVSDVVTVSGMAGGYGDPARTDAFALQVSYDPSQLVLAPGGTEESIAAGGCIYLAWLNPTGWNGTDPLWVNAGDGNFGNNASLAQEGYFGSFADFEAVYGTDLNAYLGAWGVDTVTDVAWAVLNHNSDFAVVPEPATLALLALGGLAMMARRKKN